MRPTLMVAALAVMLAPSTFARTERSYDKGTLLSMESVSCGYQQNSGKSVASEIIGNLARPGSVTSSGRFNPTALQASGSSRMRPAPKRIEVG